MKLIFVVDIRGWAFDNIARSVANKLRGHYDVNVIYWEDFKTPDALTKSLADSRADHVHFFFREHLNLLITSRTTDINTLENFCKSVITTHIPDYLYSSEADLASRYRLFHFIDGYFTTNSDLLRIYEKSRVVPDPLGVIHDWPEVHRKKRIAKPEGSVRILWSGNSKWGEYAGYRDYKGLRAILLPAIEKLQENFSHVQFVCMDSSQKRYDHEEVMEELSKAHITVIASVREGTPLTLIEAMAHGCAVVSTPVGISQEVLPDEQLPFICARTSEAFYSALSTLSSNTDLIRSLGEKNARHWEMNFGPDSPLIAKWHNFLLKALNHHHKRGAEAKLRLLPKRSKAPGQIIIPTARTIAQIVNKYGLTDSLNRISPKFSNMYHSIVHGGHIDQNNYDVLDQYYRNTARDSSPLVVYSPMWKGVSSSTEAIFTTQNLMRFPFTDSEYPEVTAHPYLDHLADIISEQPEVKIILSGGSLIQRELAVRIKRKNPSAKQYLLWHGSPAQWIEAGHLEFFRTWLAEWQAKTIEGFITLKPGLDQVLSRMGIDAFPLSNPIPSAADTLHTHPRDSVKVGLFSAINSWIKNPYPQLLALSGRPDISLTTNLRPSDISGIGLTLGAVEHLPPLPHSEFQRHLSAQHVNLYITYSECSPMIPLESWANLVPCIVGPAGDVYSRCSSELASYLVEPNADNANAISQRLDLVLRNYEHVRMLLEQHLATHSAIVSREKNNLFEWLDGSSAISAASEKC